MARKKAATVDAPASTNEILAQLAKQNELMIKLVTQSQQAADVAPVRNTPAPRSAVQQITNALKVGERVPDLRLEVVEAFPAPGNAVEFKLKDRRGTIYLWRGTSPDAFRLQVGQHFVLAARVIKIDGNAVYLNHGKMVKDDPEPASRSLITRRAPR